ncbi:MAG TPA: MBL fold metallo-hydrolase [Flavobacteriaceae bacterium]|nr:MBL fold metallo-hydrolase [Flavobacteriaceae bacterium]
MKIKILGTRAKIKPSAKGYQNFSGYLIDEKILLDVGEEKFLSENPEAIIFTHFHPDHAYFEFDQAVFQPDIPHYGPEGNPNLPQQEIISSPFKIGEYSITPFPVIHALSLKSLAYLIEKGNKKLFYTGDVAWIEKKHLSQLPKVDLVITEATFIKKGGRINRKDDQIYGHTGVPDLIRIFKPHTNHIVFSHYGEWFYEDIPKALDTLKNFESDQLKITPASDGMEINI